VRGLITEWRRRPRAHHLGRIARRAVAAAITAIALYIFAPAVLKALGAWPEVSELRPWWLAGMALTQSASIWCLWRLQAVAIGTEDHWAVATSQLAGGALGRIIPGGAATATAAQYGMFAAATDDEVRRSSVATGLAMATALQVAGLCALPLLALPAIILGLRVDPTFEHTALLGIAIFAGMALITWAVNRSEPLLRGIGTAFTRVADKLPRVTPPENLPNRLVAMRDDARARLGDKLPEAVFATLGRWIFDFLTLAIAVLAVGGKPSVWLLLLAFFTAQLLGQISITPGGIGVVEAGLTAALGIAGLSASAAAIATLAYRLFNYGLMLPAGFVGWVIHRRRMTLAGRVEYDPDELFGDRAT